MYWCAKGKPQQGVTMYTRNVVRSSVLALQSKRVRLECVLKRADIKPLHKARTINELAVVIAKLRG